MHRHLIVMSADQHFSFCIAYLNRGYDTVNKKTIAILTSGGDAPGMNAAVRAVTRAAASNGIKVLGVRRGYNGLLREDFVSLNLRSVSDIIHRGGTVLFTARCPEYNSEEGVRKACDICKKHSIDSLITIGGDGTFRGARDLSRHSIQCIGIPGTIDNDIGCSDYTVGFDTAMNTALQMVDKLRDTAESHERCSVVEVMGRRCGDIALQTGIAVGATAILVPEVSYDFNRDVIERILYTQKIGKKHFIVIVSEGIGGVEKMARLIEEKTGVEARSTILGHVQRGGPPSLRDRLLASYMGAHAVDILLNCSDSRIVAMNNCSVVDYPIEKALAMTGTFDFDLYKTALEISV